MKSSNKEERKKEKRKKEKRRESGPCQLSEGRSSWRKPKPSIRLSYSLLWSDYMRAVFLHPTMGSPVLHLPHTPPLSAMGLLPCCPPAPRTTHPLPTLPTTPYAFCTYCQPRLPHTPAKRTTCISLPHLPALLDTAERGRAVGC